MLFLIEETVMTARAKAAKLLEKHDSVIIAVDFKTRTVHDVFPVITNNQGDFVNEKDVRSELKNVNCQPRKLKPQVAMRVM